MGRSAKEHCRPPQEIDGGGLLNASLVSSAFKSKGISGLVSQARQRKQTAQKPRKYGAVSEMVQRQQAATRSAKAQQQQAPTLKSRLEEPSGGLVSAARQRQTQATKPMAPTQATPTPTPTPTQATKPMAPTTTAPKKRPSTSGFRRRYR